MLFICGSRRNKTLLPFGWDNGLIVRVLPNHMPARPENINNYFVEADLVNELIQVPESIQGKRPYTLKFDEDRFTLQVSTSVKIEDKKNQTNLWLDASFSERVFNSSSSRCITHDIPEHADDVWSKQNNELKSIFISTGSTSKETMDQINNSLSEDGFLAGVNRDRIEFSLTGAHLKQFVRYIKGYQLDKSEISEYDKHLSDKELVTDAITVSWTKHADDLW